MNSIFGSHQPRCCCTAVCFGRQHLKRPKKDHQQKRYEGDGGDIQQKFEDVGMLSVVQEKRKKFPLGLKKMLNGCGSHLI